MTKPFDQKKILITGAAGFIGSHLTERLLDEVATVRAFIHYNSANSWGWLEKLPKEKLSRIEIFSGDLRDPNGVRQAVKDIDIVFHLAALIGIPFSYHSPDTYVDTNIKGTLNILQASRSEKVQRVLITSTSEVYGTACYVPIDEKHPRQGQSPYSATKIGADALGDSFFRSFDLPITIVRPFNTYGPRQSARAVIPTIITQVSAGAKEIKLGSLTPTRDLVFVKDTVEGFIKLAECDSAIGQEVNIATQNEISVGKLAETIITFMESDAKVIRDADRFRPEKSEVERLLGSNQKLYNLTNWKPGYSLEDGLQATIDWFRSGDNTRFYKSQIYNV
jgi:NAD dependent epimerase/dehydratase